jgi:hypothetical protein
MPPIDLAPFESAMPPAIAEELRGTHEAIRSWRWNASTLYIDQAGLSPAALGWALGVAVLHGIESDFRNARAASGEMRAAILEAIVVGRGAGRPSKPAQWKEAEAFLTCAERLP